MASKTKKIIFLSIIILALAGAAVGYYLYNKGPRDVKSASGIAVTAVHLYQSYLTDSTGAKQKYTDRIVEVTGEISEVSENLQQQQIIMLKSNTEGAYVNCTLEEKAASIPSSGTIKIKGITSGIGQGDADLGISGDVYLTRCYIIQSK